MTTPLQHTSLGELGYTPLVATSLGEIGSATIPVEPSGSGINDAMLRIRNLRRQTQRNIKHLLLVSAIFVATEDESYERRQDEQTDAED